MRPILLIVALAGGLTPLTEPDSKDVQIAQLKKDVAMRDATNLSLEAKLHTCEATKEQTLHQLESFQLTERVERQLAILKSLDPDADWTWDNNALAVVKLPKPKQAEGDTKEPKK